MLMVQRWKFCEVCLKEKKRLVVDAMNEFTCLVKMVGDDDCLGGVKIIFCLIGYIVFEFGEECFLGSSSYKDFSCLANFKACVKEFGEKILLIWRCLNAHC